MACAGKPADVGPGKPDLSGWGVMRPASGAQRRAFSCAVAAEDGDDLFFSDLQPDSLQDAERPVSDFQIVDSQAATWEDPRYAAITRSSRWIADGMPSAITMP